MKGTGEITCNEIQKPCIEMVVTVGDHLLYKRMLPTEDYPISSINERTSS